MSKFQPSLLILENRLPCDASLGYVPPPYPSDIPDLPPPLLLPPLISLPPEPPVDSEPIVPPIKFDFPPIEYPAPLGPG